VAARDPSPSRRRTVRRRWFVWCACLTALIAPPAPADAQQDSTAPPRTGILEFPNLGPVPGAVEPSMGPGPGAFTPGMDGGPGIGVVGSRRRTGRLPRMGARPGLGTVAAGRSMALPETLPAPTPTSPGVGPATSIDAAILDDEGPATGLTLDAAIDRVMRENLDIRALRHELPQADADVLTAGLRTNPLIYMDTQFIPYGSFTDARPGGPTQYDLNITYPIDVSRKRQARTLVARMARSTVEAQFQDVVRRQIDNVYRGFVTLQATRLDLLMTRAELRRQQELLARLERTLAPGDADAADTLDHLVFVLERARTRLGEAEEAYADAQEGLAVLLGVPVEETAGLEPRGRLHDHFPAPPGLDELTAIALRCRPDLQAARLGVNRAGAEVALQRANRFDDVYLFYDPITYQDNRPAHALSSRSWAIGLTFSLPIFNRNQGNIARAQSNVAQTKLELSSLERRIASEVRLAEREYQRADEALEQLETAVLPRSAALVKRKTEQLAAGSLSPDDYQGHLEAAAEVTQSHRDAIVRLRRAMLDLNTAVGLRILP